MDDGKKYFPLRGVGQGLAQRIFQMMLYGVVERRGVVAQNTVAGHMSDSFDRLSITKRRL